jgi:hypothetical protein
MMTLADFLTVYLFDRSGLLFSIVVKGMGRTDLRANATHFDGWSGDLLEGWKLKLGWCRVEIEPDAVGFFECGIGSWREVCQSAYYIIASAANDASARLDE